MIIDCFTFWNELDLLEIRLNTLGPVVDFFVLVEATKRFSGKINRPTYATLCTVVDRQLGRQTTSPTLRDLEPILRWRHKIVHVLVDDMPDVVDGDRWALEHFQRNAILRGLAVIAPRPDALVLIGDVDEIPHPELVQIPAVHRMRLYYYYLDRYLGPWVGTVGVPYHVLFTQPPEAVRQSREGQRIVEGGWHFSCLGGPQEVVRKLGAFAHAELDTPDGHTKLTAAILARQDHNGRGELALIDRSHPGAFPPYVIAHWERFSHLADEGQQESHQWRPAWHRMT